MKKIVYSVVLLCVTFFAQAQNNKIIGIVTNESDERLPFATLQWAYSTIGTTADSLGAFMIKSRKKTDTLIVTYAGYAAARVVVEPQEKKLWIVLKGVANLQDIEIIAKREDNFVSTLENRHVEQISSCELRKAPCCNLAGSFETNGSVDVSTNNAVTGATEIQMLGLRGIYTQLTLQKRPNFYGLAYPFALEFYPGTWLNGISVSKGASSVEQGIQSLTGQINVDLVKPSEDKALFINLYESTNQTFEANIHLNRKLNKTLSVGTMFHFDDMKRGYDHDNDGFMNMPQKRQINSMTRILHQGKTWFGQVGIHLIRDSRVAGQITDISSSNLRWRVQQDMSRLDIGGTIGYLGLDKIYNSIALVYGVTVHRTDELYGRNTHKGTQQSLYGNLIYATIIGNTNHRLNLGTGIQYDDFKENVNDITLDRKDILPGVFGEYSYNRPKIGANYSDWGIIVGLRNDYHNHFGNVVAPRLNMKYNFSQDMIWRASAGRGWRVANIIAENLNVLASNRQIQIAPNLKPEDGWNMGTNFSMRFSAAGRKMTFSADAYHTRFVNQIVVDQDSDYKKVFFYNLDGKSYANSIMGVLTVPIFTRFDVKLGYKFNDVKSTFGGSLNVAPLMAAHRGLITLDYKTRDESWLFHVTGNYIGRQRLPQNLGLPAQYQPHIGENAPAYININAQITKIMGKWEIYFGGENLTNYVQHQPILAYREPFSDYFNASQIWGPLMGIRGFLGVRYSIPQSAKD